jgi:hypothetical protein
MRVTPETMKALIRELNSVTMTLVLSSRVMGLPSHRLRSMSGMTRERRLNVPMTHGWGVLGICVTLGRRMISSTLATLMA